MKCHLYSLQLLQYHLSYCLTYMSERPQVGHGFGGGGEYEDLRVGSSTARATSMMTTTMPINSRLLCYSVSSNPLIAVVVCV
jgi:hypothetical protein